jgi:hypothetical protein
MGRKRRSSRELPPPRKTLEVKMNKFSSVWRIGFIASLGVTTQTPGGETGYRPKGLKDFSEEFPNFSSNGLTRSFASLERTRFPSNVMMRESKFRSKAYPPFFDNLSSSRDLKRLQQEPKSKGVLWTIA